MIGMPPRSSVFGLGLVLGFAAGWYLNGLRGEIELFVFKSDLAAAAEDQRALKAKVEAAQITTNQQSTQRLNEQQAQREKEVRYVDREVIHYRDRWRDSACRLPAEWLRLYNRALGVGGAEPASAVPSPAKL